MRRFLTLACLWISIAGCAKGQPADVAEAAYETLPKYGDPDYQTIWSRASGAERESLTTFSPGAASRGWSW